MIFSYQAVQLIISIIISLTIIYLIQSIFNYLIDTYSIPKSKDLVNSQLLKYKNIIHELQQPTQNGGQVDTISMNDQSMNDELMEYMNQQ
jgi:hypothetical protein